MSGTHTVLYDPHGLMEAELPLDRAPYEALGTAVLAWKDPHLELPASSRDRNVVSP